MECPVGEGDMDRARVEQIARNHKALAQSRAHDVPDGEAADAADGRRLEQLWKELERNAGEYCDVYNQAFGAVRIRSEFHGDTIVVRSEADQEHTLVLRRTLPSPGHPASIEAHRYHYTEPPLDLPVGVGRSSGTLNLTHHGEDTTAAEIVVELVSAFAEQLALADSNQGRQGG
jgi:hypothetical protein